MSGFEIAGIVLGGIPLLISGLEHWREVARIGGYYRHIRREHQKCVKEITYNGILYKRNLRALLHHLVDEDEVTRLVGDPESAEWKSKSLGSLLEDRLQESYASYMTIMRDMDETIAELKKVTSLDNTSIQSQLSAAQVNQSGQASFISTAKTKIGYQMFRVKFSLSEQTRNELFQQLKTNNERLEKLLSTSDHMPYIRNTQRPPVRTEATSALDSAIMKARKSSELLFKAFQKAWQCTCQHNHFANLRLEHRTLPEMSFEVILMSTASSTDSYDHWSWKELRCGEMNGCMMEKRQLLKPPDCSGIKEACVNTHRLPIPIQLKKKRVAFRDPTLIPSIELNSPVPSNMRLCQVLRSHSSQECMGVIGADSEIYHLHPLDRRRRPMNSSPYTLDHLLSSKFVGHLSRRQRYMIALLIASSVAQLQHTAWLTSGLTKEDILFYPCEDDASSIDFREPFIRQGFRPDGETLDPPDGDYNMHSLGILLLELCFGKRLEDYSPRQAYPTSPVEAKQVYDTFTAVSWARSVEEESGPDYASAVNWCFMGAKTAGHSWRREIIKNAIRPLESCQEHFKQLSTLSIRI